MKSIRGSVFVEKDAIDKCKDIFCRSRVNPNECLLLDVYHQRPINDTDYLRLGSFAMIGRNEDEFIEQMAMMDSRRIWIQYEIEQDNATKVYEYFDRKLVMFMYGYYFKGRYKEENDLYRISDIEFNDLCKEPNSNPFLYHDTDGGLHIRFFEHKGIATVIDSYHIMDERNQKQNYYFFIADNNEIKNI